MFGMIGKLLREAQSVWLAGELDERSKRGYKSPHAHPLAVHPIESDKPDPSSKPDKLARHDTWISEPETYLAPKREPYKPEKEIKVTILSERNRPNPLGDAATKVGGVWAALGGIVGALAIFGVLSNAQAEAIRTAGESLSPVLMAVGALVGGVMPIVTGLVAAFGTAKSAKANVTPIADPRVVDPLTGLLAPLVISPSMAGRHALRDDDE